MDDSEPELPYDFEERAGQLLNVLSLHTSAREAAELLTAEFKDRLISIDVSPFSGSDKAILRIAAQVEYIDQLETLIEAGMEDI